MRMPPMHNYSKEWNCGIMECTVYNYILAYKSVYLGNSVNILLKKEKDRRDQRV